MQRGFFTVWLVIVSYKLTFEVEKNPKTAPKLGLNMKSLEQKMSYFFFPVCECTKLPLPELCAVLSAHHLPNAK